MTFDDAVRAALTAATSARFDEAGALLRRAEAGIGIFLVELHDTLRGIPMEKRFSPMNP